MDDIGNNADNNRDEASFAGAWGRGAPGAQMDNRPAAIDNRNEEAWPDMPFGRQGRERAQLHLSMRDARRRMRREQMVNDDNGNRGVRNFAVPLNPEQDAGIFNRNEELPMGPVNVRQQQEEAPQEIDNNANNDREANIPQQLEEARQELDRFRGRVRRLRHEGLWELHRQRRARLEIEMLENERRDPEFVLMQHEMLRDRRRDERRRRREAFFRRERAQLLPVARAAEENNNPLGNNDQNDNHANVAGLLDAPIDNNNRPGQNGEEDNDDDFDDFMMLDLGEGRIEGRVAALRAALDNIPSNLFNMVQEGRTCISVLSGWGRTEENSCQSIVQHCRNNTEEAGYVSRLGRKPLHEACLKGACRHVIQALMATNNRGADESDFQRNTPLHLLFRDTNSPEINNGNLVWSPQELSEMVGDLLSVNPSVIASRTNVDGETPLHSACMAPETMVDPSTIVRLLEASPSAATRLNRKNQTPLRLHCQRRNASTEVAGLLLKENTNALIVLDTDHGWAPIHAAAANANFELLRYLVESFPDSVKVQTSQRQTTLHLLCQYHTHLSSPTQHQNIGNRSNRQGNNNIHNVAAAVDFLLKADPDAILHKDRTDGYTPLHLVCKTEGSRQVPLAVLKLLLECNESAARIADNQQFLPLHHACEMGANPEVIRALLEAYPEATNALTTKSDTPLSLAAKANKSAETVKLLIEANPSVLTKTNDYGFCPLHCVCRANQPRMGIVQALVDACPESLNLQTNAGETPFHLARSSTGTFAGVLHLLSQNQSKTQGLEASNADEVDESGKVCFFSSLSEFDGTGTATSQNARSSAIRAVTNNKMGNTPLHDACIRFTPYEQLEVIAKANPEYILVRNNAGFTPLQILCKNGRIDERIISTFSQIGGPEIFSVKDANGHTPLHSAMRKDIDLQSLRCLIRASPDALRCRTADGDLPLHLACLKKCSAEIVQEVAIAACCGDNSLAVVPNLAGQTPIGIAMGEFKGIYMEETAVAATFKPSQQRIFHVLSTLVKIVHYGPVKCQQHGTKALSLLKACVVLHRQNIRLDPMFIRQVIHVYPEEVKLVDEDGNCPLHIEASIPIEKMALLDGDCTGSGHRRMGILRTLLEAYPTACSFRNKENHFPLGLMIQAGRVWGHTIAVALRAFPPALHWYKGLDDRFSSILLERASKECGVDTLFALIKSRPGLFDAASRDRLILPPNAR